MMHNAGMIVPNAEAKLIQKLNVNHFNCAASSGKIVSLDRLMRGQSCQSHSGRTLLSSSDESWSIDWRKKGQLGVVVSFSDHLASPIGINYTEFFKKMTGLRKVGVSYGVDDEGQLLRRLVRNCTSSFSQVCIYKQEKESDLQSLVTSGSQEVEYRKKRVR